MNRTKRIHADASSKEDEKGEKSSSTATAVIEQHQTDDEFDGWRGRKRVNTPDNTGTECHVARTYVNGASFGGDDDSSACYNVSSTTDTTADANTLKTEFEENDVHPFIYQLGDRRDHELILFVNGVITRSRSDPTHINPLKDVNS